MEEKDDLETPGDGLGPPQRQFPLELSSGLRDIMPLPEIVFARLRQSSDVINDIINDILVSFAYGISAT